MSEKKYDVSKVKKWLSEFRVNERDIDDQIERLERMQARLESCSAPEITDMPRSPGFATDKMSLLLARKIDLETKLHAYIETQREYEDRIEYLISKLPKWTERVIIRRKYIDAERWEDITFTLYGDKEDYLQKEESYKRNMFLIHGDALEFIAQYFEESGDPEVAFFHDFVPKMI